MFDFKEFGEGIKLLQSVLSSIKVILDILPKSRKNEDVVRTLQDAAVKLQLSEVQIAKGLGYEICKCTWPPQIMLFVRDVEYGEEFRCPSCGRVVSPDDITPPKDWRII